MITRFAPTPSGYLHAGNAANALLVSWLAHAHDGQVALRIDDADTARSRPEYVADVFDLLAWLDIDWQLGPTDVADFDTRWSARHRVADHRAALDAAITRGLPVYACACSRSQQPGPATGGCRGGCAGRDLALEPGRTVLRVRVPVDTIVDVGAVPVRLAAELGDFVVWRRDDLPAYQLASVVDDRDLQVTDVVRGVDLLTSTAAQLHLAPALGADAFVRARFWHHDLVPADDGSKLSKSQHGRGGPLPRTAESKAQVVAVARRLGAPLGVAPVD